MGGRRKEGVGLTLEMVNKTPDSATLALGAVQKIQRTRNMKLHFGKFSFVQSYIYFIAPSSSCRGAVSALMSCFRLPPTCPCVSSIVAALAAAATVSNTARTKLRTDAIPSLYSCTPRLVDPLPRKFLNCISGYVYLFLGGNLFLYINIHIYIWSHI